MKKKCVKCKIFKTVDNFNKSKNLRDGLQKYCIDCKKQIDLNYINKTREEIKSKARRRNKECKEWIDNIKKQLCCSKCGEKRHYLIEFHHLDPKLKINTVTNLLWQKRKDKSIVEEEIKKCIPLCSNCHTEFHYLEKLNGITTEQYISRDTEVVILQAS